jgi:hypothetical protein
VIKPFSDFLCFFEQRDGCSDLGVASMPPSHLQPRVNLPMPSAATMLHSITSALRGTTGTLNDDTSVRRQKLTCAAATFLLQQQIVGKLFCCNFFFKKASGGKKCQFQYPSIEGITALLSGSAHWRPSLPQRTAALEQMSSNESP